MQVAAGDGSALRGDLITRVELRTDLTPIPSTVEVTAVKTAETVSAMVEGKTLKVGGTQTEYLIVKVEDDNTARLVRGSRELAPIKAIGILQSCAALGGRLQRSILREGSNFQEIYRSIGATSVVEADFTVPLFACLIGGLPTPAIARVLQEEAAAVFLANDKLRFRRLAELIAEPAAISYDADRTEVVKSSFLERHAVPFAFTTNADKSFLSSKREAQRGLIYRPRADLRTLNNISSALIQRRTLVDSLSPDFNAGTRVDIEGRPHVVITAVHVRATSNGANDGAEYTKLYLGEFVT